MPRSSSIYALTRREQILQKAAERFHVRGYHSTTLEDITGDLNIKRPAFYRYFQSKEELLAEIYDRAVMLMIDQLTPVLAGDASPKLKLEGFFREFLRSLIEEKAIVAVYFQEKVNLPPTLTRKIRSRERLMTRMVRDALEEGIRGGAFRPMDTRLMANAIFGMLIWVYQWHGGPGSRSADEIATHFYQFALGGLELREVVGNE